MDILKRPMFYAAVVCCLAATLSICEIPLAYPVIAVAIIALTITVFNKKYKYITVIIAIVIFTISLISETLIFKTIQKHNNKSIDGKFLVVADPINYEASSSVTLRAISNDTLPKNTKYLVFCDNDHELEMGDVVNATIELNVINKYDKYRISNYSNGIYVTANLKHIEKTDDSNFIYKSAGNIRKYVKRTVTERFDGDSAGLLVALTTGERTMLSDEFLHNVKTTGISHVIVVSGMHLSIIMTAVFWLLDRLFYNKYLRSILSIAVVLIISAVCGFTMSITRAGLMFIIGGLAPIFDRDNDSLNSLMTAFTVVLIISPFAVANVSFLLSFLSTLALVWIMPFYYNALINKFNISSKILKVILGMALCSISAIIYTLPVTIKVFSYVSIVSPITNLLITFPVTFVLVLNIVAITISALPVIGIIGDLLLWVANLCSQIIVFLVNSIAKLPITVAVLPKGSFWWSVVIVAIIVGYMYFYNLKSKKKRSDLNANSL